jgi:hypothetical protein
MLQWKILSVCVPLVSSRRVSGSTGVNWMDGTNYQVISGAHQLCMEIPIPVFCSAVLLKEQNVTHSWQVKTLSFLLLLLRNMGHFTDLSFWYVCVLCVAVSLWMLLMLSGHCAAVLELCWWHPLPELADGTGWHTLRHSWRIRAGPVAPESVGAPLVMTSSYVWQKCLLASACGGVCQCLHSLQI